jgi:uncharacterized protein (DUF3084 family)
VQTQLVSAKGILSTLSQAVAKAKGSLNGHYAEAMQEIARYRDRTDSLRTRLEARSAAYGQAESDRSKLASWAASFGGGD